MNSTTNLTLPTLSFVTGVSQWDVLLRNLARSPCLQSGHLKWSAVCNAKSAADAFNPALIAAEQVLRDSGDHQTQADHWLVWVHQDVFLPAGWDFQFANAIGNQQLTYLDVEYDYYILKINQGTTTAQSPRFCDKVRVNYSGSLMDGTNFDRTNTTDMLRFGFTQQF